MSLENRYDSINVVLNEKKKRVYSTVLYPTIERDPSDIYIVTNEVDRLDLLAYKYYNDVRYWWIIAQANFLGKGGFYVPGGLRLRIPKNLSKIVSDFNALNESR